MNLVTARRPQSEVQCIGHVLSPHVVAKLPGDDVAARVVEDRTEIEPAPAEDLDVGEVCLPKLVDGRRLVLELIARLQDDEGGTGDQIMRLERAIHRGFRDKIAFFIRERHGQLAWRQFRLLQRQFHNLALHFGGNPVPDVLRLGRLILQSNLPALQISVIPAIECGAWNTQLGQCPTR